MMSESQTDMLINRIASSDETGGEFARFEAAAAASPSEWERLARALRDELHLRGALHDALDGLAAAEIERAYEERDSESSSSAVHSVFRGWSGWAAAAVLALAWTTVLVMRTGGTPAPPGPSQPAVQFASLSADEALEQYLRLGEFEGRIVGELPAVLVESYEADDGGLEVLFVRQIVERDRVAKVYNLAEDEHGAYVPVPVNPASILSWPSSM